MTTERNPARFRPKGLTPGQHALQPTRDLHSALPKRPPKILLAILAKQKEITLPLYLRCIEALDYPKASIVIYIRTNNNRDRTEAILAEWAALVRGQYAAIEMDAADVEAKVEAFGVHEWNATRFSVLAKIRTDSLARALDHGCDFYFTADVDNFVRPCTLRELVALNLPIVAPLLRSVDRRALYLNCHVDIDENGYYRDCDQYDWIFGQKVVGVFELPVVHCTYLIRASCIPDLAYADGSTRHEYVIFSDVARKAGIPQYYDNRQVYGYLTLAEEAEAASQLIGPEIGAALGDKREVSDLSTEVHAAAGEHPSARSSELHLTPERPGPSSPEQVARPVQLQRTHVGNGRQKIGLSMIVKNETRSIRRCLESVLPFIDYWAIVDTGSTDGTQDLIKTLLAEAPGELKESPWVDFASNRNEALDLARPHCDYIFFIDADDFLELPPKFALPALGATSYYVEIQQKELRYWRPHLRADLPWRFDGVLHEFLTCGVDKNNQRLFPENLRPQRLAKAVIHMTESGARRQVAAQERFARDAALLEKALESESDTFLIARYTFYLAQSRRDAGDRASALAAYLARADMGFWEQEVFISLYQAAGLMEELGRPAEEILETYRRAAAVDRQRAEALHGAARFCRLQGRLQEGYEFAKRAIKLPTPETALFVQQWIYDYGALDEYAVCAYGIGRYEDCLKASRRIQAGSAVPDSERPRVRANIDHALDRMREQQRARS